MYLARRRVALVVSFGTMAANSPTIFWMPRAAPPRRHVMFADALGADGRPRDVDEHHAVARLEADFRSRVDL